MPELPEVETIRRQLEPLLVGKLVVGADSHPSEKFRDAPLATGGCIESVRRRGKYLLIGLRGLQQLGGFGSDSNSAQHHELIVHLGMTGRLAVQRHDSVDLGHPHLRAWWMLEDESVFTFHDIRRFGRVRVVTAGSYESIPTLHKLGPEPFSAEFTPKSLWLALRASSRRLKTQLLSQRPVAGIGNIYADESLWLARINPVVTRLSLQRAGRLVTAIREALDSGLKHGGTTLRDYVTVDGDGGSNQHHLYCYGRWREPCERCGTELRRRIIDARSTTWCPRCQRH